MESERERKTVNEERVYDTESESDSTSNPAFHIYTDAEKFVSDLMERKKKTHIKAGKWKIAVSHCSACTHTHISVAFHLLTHSVRAALQHLGRMIVENMNGKQDTNVRQTERSLVLCESFY